MPPETMGPHLTLDLRGCKETDRLTSIEQGALFLNELPDVIGMTKLMPPYVFRYSDCDKVDMGVTGFVVIAESHISLHTYENRDYVFVDIFSCRPFDVDVVTDFVVCWFESEDYDKRVTMRGRGWKDGTVTAGGEVCEQEGS